MKTPVYFIMGTRGSGRREILLDLMSSGFEPGSRLLFCRHGEEPADALDTRLQALPGLEMGTWAPDSAGKLICPIPEDSPPDAVFIMAAGHLNPIDQLEALRDWLREVLEDFELARIITVLDCTLAHANQGKLDRWFEACIHFSDVVLLNRREGVPQQWLQAFQELFNRAFLPCVFEPVRKGRIRNPALILQPEARRMSLIFEFLELDSSFEGVVEEDDEASEDDASEGDEEDDDVPGEDPWLERDQAGRRLKPLPDIRAFLPAPISEAVKE